MICVLLMLNVNCDPSPVEEHFLVGVCVYSGFTSKDFFKAGL